MILYGVAGWSYDDWAGRVYPKPRPAGFHPLPYLAAFIDLMELNSSFYALPRPDHAARWVELLEPFPEFRFTAKLHQGFTHGALDDVRADAAEAFRVGVAPLAEAGRLLALLVQFPVTFRAGAEAWTRLERIRDLFAEETLVLELRHRSWFEAERLERLRRLRYGLAQLDLPAARDHPPEEHGGLVGPGYLRLHGRNRAAWFDARAGRDDRYDYRYGQSEVRTLADRLRGIDKRSEKALLVANNHFGGQALAVALEIKAEIEDRPPLAPAPLVEAFPDLRERVRTPGQQTLF
ncbi:MAG: DUF72 domain-containing protein [Planctomycetota bacterium]|nr:DUF72 domain-containing protein [Planctomycetota bacterium]